MQVLKFVSGEIYATRSRYITASEVELVFACEPGQWRSGSGKDVAEPTGLEPATSNVTGWR
ncbi:MAG: hypothetical protein ABI857_13770, partial [Acidobacteriota bacterium]